MYQIEGREVLFDWLSHETDQFHRERMLEWMARFAESPLVGAYRVPDILAPVYLAVTPVRRTYHKFLLAEQFHAIKLIEFASLA